MTDHTTYAVDLAKSVFEIAVSHHPGHVKERHRLSRERFLTFFAQQEPGTALLEACGSAHHWARSMRTLGHNVVLLPPHRVRPYVTGNKTDRSDAKALLEAMRNEDIQPVPIKSIDQQSLTALHRLRSAWIAARTARINTVRGLLREFGVFIPLGAKRVRPTFLELLEDPDSPLPHALRPALAGCADEISQFEHRLANLEAQLNALARAIPDIQLLRTIPGVGPITATALIAFVGSVQRSLQDDTSPHTWDSHRGNDPPVLPDGSVPSASEAIPTSGCYSSTVLDPSSGAQRERPTLTRSRSGHSRSSAQEDTTKPQ